ncbi:MAG TPA: short-chain dehydrogenase [Planctomycetes bacterium]|nr:short-chain dehydrogenase [Planctomycetota bacterium]
MAAGDPIEANLSSKTYVVTGSNTGIGKEIARGLNRLGARVILACRNQTKAAAAKDDIVSSTGNDAVELIALDQGDPSSVKAFAAEVAQRHDQLDGLVNNAGCWLTTYELDPQGIERTFTVNTLGYWRLTNALEPLLIEGGGGRVVNVASEMAYGLQADDLGYQRRRWSGPAAYAQSKQGNRMLSWVRAERLRDKGVTVNALHPGVVSTEIARNGRGIVGGVSRVYFKVFGLTPTMGADTALWLAASPEAEGHTGKFWVKRRQKRRRFHDMERNRALWKQLESLG